VSILIELLENYSNGEDGNKRRLGHRDKEA
jgi:hypothetical protein